MKAASSVAVALSIAFVAAGSAVANPLWSADLGGAAGCTTRKPWKPSVAQWSASKKFMGKAGEAAEQCT